MSLSFLKAGAVALVAVVLAACVTARGISLQEARGFKLTAVEVRAEQASVNWPEATIAYLNARNVDTNDPASADLLRTPEARAEIGKKIADRMTPQLRAVLGARMTGDRPVRVVLHVEQLSIPSDVSRFVSAVIIGGNLHPQVFGRFEVYDARSGARLLEHRDNVSQAQIGGIAGFVISSAIEASQTQPAVERLGAGIATKFVNWLYTE